MLTDKDSLSLPKAIVNLLSFGKKDFNSIWKFIITYENSIITLPYGRSFFSSYFTLEVKGAFYFFKGVLFAQYIPKELNLLWMEYDVALRLENTESQK